MRSPSGEVLMRWITREHPKIDRVACPWLITRFIDPQAEFLFAPPADVRAQSAALNAIPSDVERVELSHDRPSCSFAAFQHKDRLTDAAVPELAAFFTRAAAIALTLSLRPRT